MKRIMELLVVTSLLILPVSQQARASEVESGLINNLVRVMGYGGAIHQFDNYLLRGDDKYRLSAEQNLYAAKYTIYQLTKRGVATPELKALDKTVQDYLQALVTLEEMVLDGNSPKERDAAVKIDDAVAAENLDKLLQQNSWKSLAELR